MPWVKFLKDHRPYKKGEVVDLPSYRLAFQLKNAGVLVRVPPPGGVKKAVRRLVGKK